MRQPRSVRRLRAYAGPVRSPAREARRRVVQTVRAGAGRRAVADTYWWEYEPNFGDELTAWLLPRHGLAVRRRPVDRASVVAIGSTLEHLPLDYSGWVFGSGLMFDEPRSLPRARVLALRGELTRAHLDASPRALGDPGLLVANLGIPTDPAGPAALVPHLSHRRQPELLALHERNRDRLCFVDAAGTPETVVRTIACSRAVISTSLHGLIVADALGVPAVWAMPAPLLAGSRFKFHDYESVVTPGWTREVRLSPGSDLDELIACVDRPCPRVLARTVKDLTDVLAGLARELPTTGPVDFLLGR